MHEEILQALRSGDHEQALALARTATRADPGDATAHRLMAQALRLGEDPRGALESIDRAIAISPDDSGLHLLRAIMLLGSHEMKLARQELDQAIELDPNQLGAYLLQAELALGRGDLDEAERLARVGMRIVPDHPLLQAVEAMVALVRGDNKQALTLIAGPLEQAPDDPQVLNAAGFIYMGNGHDAFAEQAFRRLRELKPDHHALRRVLGELLFRQERFGEALDEVEPLLEMSGVATTENQLFAGFLALRAGEPERGLRWLRNVLATAPDDEVALDLAMKAWSRLGDVDGARNALEALLSTSPQVDLLWRARQSVETTRDAVFEVVQRWMAAIPDSTEAHQARVRLQMEAGDLPAAENTLKKVLELAPDHVPSVGLLADLVAMRDPDAAVDIIRTRMKQVEQGSAGQQQLRGWLALANANAGDLAEATRVWTEMHAELAESLAPLPAPTAADAPRKPAAEPAEGAPPLAFLAGLPGSGVERVARLLDGVVPAFRSDRIRSGRPLDQLQNFNAITGLADGSADAATLVAQWREALPARGLAADGPVIDWLLWWDNALLDVIGPHLPQARILLAVRDPRDMLLNWLAFGAPLPFRLDAPQEAAQWLAGGLEHVAVLQEQERHPHEVIRLDEVVNDPQGMAKLVGKAVGVELPEPPPGLFQGRRFPAGRWREYAEVLADPFAILAPVAVRLGYPET